MPYASRTTRRRRQDQREGAPSQDTQYRGSLAKKVRRLFATKNNYQYTPLPKGRHIRVLTVLPSADRHARIDCTIETTQLNEEANYTALSYTWGMNEDGDATLCETLYISGKALPITRNLFQGLLRIRKDTEAMRLWIDAVCINQQDIPERNSQVALMPSVYGNSAATFVWLGEGSSEQDDQDAKFLLDVMEDTFWRLRPENDGTKCVYSTDEPRYDVNFDIEDSISAQEHCSTEVVEALQALFKPDNWPQLVYSDSTQYSRLIPASSEIWQHTMTVLKVVLSLFNRRYFSRLWIVQELFHTRRWALKILWGPCVMSGVHFDASLNHWKTLGNRIQLTYDRAAVDIEQAIRQHWIDPREMHIHTFSFPTSFKLSASETRSGGSRLLELLHKYRHQHCLDDRDKLFALLSLVPEDEAEIPADYSLTLTETCIRFTELLIRKGEFGRILQQLETQLQDTRSPPLEAPSWIFDLRKQWNFLYPKAAAVSASRGIGRLLHCSLFYVGQIMNISADADEDWTRLQVIGPSGDELTAWVGKRLEVRANDCIFTTSNSDTGNWDVSYELYLRRMSQADAYKIIQVKRLSAEFEELRPGLGDPVPVTLV